MCIRELAPSIVEDANRGCTVVRYWMCARMSKHRDEANLRCIGSRTLHGPRQMQRSGALLVRKVGPRTAVQQSGHLFGFVKKELEIVSTPASQPFT